MQKPPFFFHYSIILTHDSIFGKFLTENFFMLQILLQLPPTKKSPHINCGDFYYIGSPMGI